MKKRNVLMILSVIAGLLFIILSILLINNKLNSFDSSIYNFISKYINDTNTRIFKSITSVGSANVLIVLSLIFVMLLWRKKDSILYGSFLIITLESSYLLVTLIKEIFKRTRPDILRLVTENSYSYPSSHSLISMCFYGFLIYLTYKLIKGNIKYVIYGFLGLLILFIGISRIYLGVHYASDVLAGFSIGFVWLILCIALTNRVVKFNNEVMPKKKV